MSHLRISPRYLGQMLLADFCPRCFFYKVQLEFKLPFDMPMPGLMFHLDIFEKRLVQDHQDQKGSLPKWLKELGCSKLVDFPPKMTMDFPEYDTTLVGKPDAVFARKNGLLCVVDYKSAHYKGEGDPFLPAYATQVLGYSLLLEHHNVGQVENAALIYFENKLKDGGLEPMDLLSNDGFDVPFRVKIHEIEIDRSALDPLLKRMREFADMKTPPEGRKKCKDCARLQKLLDDEVVRRGAEDYARGKDGLARLRSRRLEAARQAARQGWEEQQDDIPVMAAEVSDSVPAPWDF